MEAEEAKDKILEILGGQVKFEGHFELVFEGMKESMQRNLLQWAKECKEKRVQPFPSPKHKSLLVFFFKPNDTRYRGILTKQKNGYFLVLFLDKHKYYDRERKKLGF